MVKEIKTSEMPFEKHQAGIKRATTLLSLAESASLRFRLAWAYYTCYDSSALYALYTSQDEFHHKAEISKMAYERLCEAYRKQLNNLLKQHD